MIKKIRDFNEKNKTIYFFIVMFILISFLAYKNILGLNTNEKCELPSNEVSTSESYEYEMKITKPDEVIYLNFRKYKEKLYIEKTEKGISTIYYVYYSNVYEKDVNGIYNRFSGNFVEGLDNKYIYIEYLDEISLLKDTVIDEDNLCYSNANINAKVCVNKAEELLNLKIGDISIDYTFSKVGEVEDFDISVNS